MQRAGLAVARLAMAIAPHARTIWIACGPGNNGGDGLAAAVHLKRWGKEPLVTWLGTERKTPHDAMASLEQAREVEVDFIEHPPAEWDLAIDALLGIGGTRPPEGRVLGAADWINRGTSPVLAVDVPTGLSADSGSGMHVRATHTLSGRSGSTTSASSRWTRDIAPCSQARHRIGPARTRRTRAATATSRWSAARRAWRAPRCWPPRPPCMPGPDACTWLRSTTPRRASTRRSPN
jgi:hydroxyethylthiazole kinase-like uncharacterized protein yjeF